ncbi:hypothetical protein A3Q56_04552 [Intoshia linei]|uniref:Uncharacterized protein n=1 Tax=Intoshia linei TaxID=1819745 RepID=A0A177B273_9BILA|nr:hypothetical protein A3Q56_04552 [Intoshia linei]
MEDVEMQPIFIYESCIVVKMAAFSNSICDHIKTWISTFAQNLYKETIAKQNNIMDTMNKMNEYLDMWPQTISDLKNILTNIHEIREMSMKTEFRMLAIIENYRILDFIQKQIRYKQRQFLNCGQI